MKRLLGLFLMSAALMCAIDLDNDSAPPAAVPEPATIGLMGAGIAAIGFAAWRKNRKK